MALCPKDQSSFSSAEVSVIPAQWRYYNAGYQFLASLVFVWLAHDRWLFLSFVLFVLIVFFIFIRISGGIMWLRMIEASQSIELVDSSSKMCCFTLLLLRIPRGLDMKSEMRSWRSSDMVSSTSSLSA